MELKKLTDLATKVIDSHGLQTHSYEIPIKNHAISLNENTKDLPNIIEVVKLIESNRKRNRHWSLALAWIVYELIRPSEELQFELLLSKLALNVNHSELVVRVLDKIEDKFESRNKAEALLLKAKAYRNLKEYSKSIENFEKAKEEYDSLNDVIQSGWVIYSFGKMFQNYLQQPQRSIEYLLNAYEIFKKATDPKRNRGISACLDEIGNVYRKSLSDVDRAEAYYNKALDHNNEVGYKPGIARNYAHLGLCNIVKNDFTEAESKLTRCIDILKTLEGQNRGIGMRMAQLGDVKLKLGDYEEAFEILKISENLLKAYSNNEYLIFNKIAQGDYFLSKQEFDKSITLYQSACEISLDQGYLKLASQSFKKLGEVYFKTGSYKDSENSLRQSMKCNIDYWQNISSISPNWADSTNRIEIGEMYSNLFSNMINDYQLNFDVTLNALSDIYETLSFEINDKLKSYNSLLRYASYMSGLKHEINNLHNDIKSVIESIMLERHIKPRMIDRLKLVNKGISEKDEALNSPRFRNIMLNKDNVTVRPKTDFLSMFNQLTTEFELSNLIIEYPHDFPECLIKGDLISYKAVFFNLLLNSAQAYARKSYQHKREVRVRSELVENRLLIDVVDSAGGMDHQEMRRVFYVGHSTKGSTGLGLPTVRNIVESFDGRIEASNHFNGFRVSLAIKILENE